MLKKISLIIVLILCLLSGWYLLKAFYIHGKAQVAQLLLERSWEKTMLNQNKSPNSSPLPDFVSHNKPWSWSDSWPVAKISFPRQSKSFIVLNHGTGRSLAFAPSHFAGSAKLGEQGVSVIGGHKDTHFKFLETIKKQDPIFLELSDGELYLYRVRDIQIANIARSELRLDSDISLLAFVACYPFHTGENDLLRYIVVAEPLDTSFPI